MYEIKCNIFVYLSVGNKINMNMNMNMNMNSLLLHMEIFSAVNKKILMKTSPFHYDL